MANPKVHICGHPKIYVPDRECTDCERLEQRVANLEDTRLVRQDIKAGNNISVDYSQDSNEVTISADMSNYYNKTEINNLLSSVLTKANILTALGYEETTLTLTDLDNVTVTKKVLVEA